MDDLIEGNRAHAEQFSDGDAPPAPARRLFVVTCMDARIDPLAMLGVGVGDAHVVRNGGGRVTDDVLRSLTLSSTLLGTRRVAVIRHTECGLHVADDEARAALAAAGVDVGDVALHTFTDVEQSVRDDVATVRRYRLTPEPLEVAGFVYDVTTGRLHHVDA